MPLARIREGGNSQELSLPRHYYNLLIGLADRFVVESTR
jgi:hypothetical protein